MITYEEAVEHFQYDEDTGILYWRKCFGFNRKNLLGKVAGTLNSNKRRRVVLKRGFIYCDQIIWLLKTKSLPNKVLRHIDGNWENTKFENLIEYDPRAQVTLTKELLNKYLSYDSETGIFTWILSDSMKRIKVGDTAGWDSGNGYINIIFFNVQYKAHRLAWFYTYGKFPEEFLDHINGIRNDNRLSNLREATKEQNSRNRKLNVNSKSGVKGVLYTKRGNWNARVTYNKKHYYLGTFDTMEQAKEAVIKKRSELHGEFANHG